MLVSTIMKYNQAIWKERKKREERKKKQSMYDGSGRDTEYNHLRKRSKTNPLRGYINRIVALVPALTFDTVVKSEPVREFWFPRPRTRIDVLICIIGLSLYLLSLLSLIPIQMDLVDSDRITLVILLGSAATCPVRKYSQPCKIHSKF